MCLLHESLLSFLSRLKLEKTGKLCARASLGAQLRAFSLAGSAPPLIGFRRQGASHMYLSVTFRFNRDFKFHWRKYINKSNKLKYGLLLSFLLFHLVTTTPENNVRIDVELPDTFTHFSIESNCASQINYCVASHLHLPQTSSRSMSYEDPKPVTTRPTKIQTFK